MQWIALLAFVRIAHGLQSAQFTLSAPGIGFRSANAIEDLSTSLIIGSVISCAALCLRDIQCRTFEFDAQSQTCRLFEGFVDTGTLLTAVSATTVVGWINVQPSMFYWYNATNDRCVDNRFLSNNDPSGLCQCSMNTFWNGSMCLNQRYAGDVCVNSHWCRSDLALSCNGLVCTSKFYRVSSSTQSHLMNIARVGSMNTVKNSVGRFSDAYIAIRLTTFTFRFHR